MKKVIAGRVYNTETAQEICQLACRYYPRDLGYHVTSLYRTRNGNYFLAGEGGPATMWARPEGTSGYTGGSGIIPVDAETALGHAERANLSAEEITEAGFTVTDA